MGKKMSPLNFSATVSNLVKLMQMSVIYPISPINLR